MPRLRVPTRQAILQSLDGSVLNRHAFEVQFDLEEEDSEIVRIAFKDDPGFTFTISAKTETREDRQGFTESVVRIYVTDEKPGEHFTDEAKEHRSENFTEAIEQIPRWVSRILSELSREARDATSQKLHAEFEKVLDELPEPSEPFTTEESTAWKQKVESILEGLRARSDANEAALQRLREEIEALFENNVAMPKKTLLRAVVGRVFGYVDGKIDLVTKTAIETIIRHQLGPGPGG